MLMSHHQSEGQNHDTETASRYVAQFKYFGMTVTGN
jgi:hypothetical protein